MFKNIIIPILVGLSTMTSMLASEINPHASFEVKNISITHQWIEFDLFIKNDGTKELLLSAYSLGLNIPKDALETNSMSFMYIDRSISQNLEPLSNIHLKITTSKDKYHLAISGYPIDYINSPMLQVNQMEKLGRFRIGNIEKFQHFNSQSLGIQKFFQIGGIQSILLAYIGSDGTATAMSCGKGMLEAQVDKNIREENQLNTLSLDCYPNPASEYMILNIPVNTDTKAELNICDLEGKRIITSTLALIRGNNKSNIDVSMLSSGKYLIEIYCNEKTAKKLIKIL